MTSFQNEEHRVQIEEHTHQRYRVVVYLLIVVHRVDTIQCSLSKGLVKTGENMVLKLSDMERGYVSMCIKQALKRDKRSMQKLRLKFGDNAQSNSLEAKVKIGNSLLAKISRGDEDGKDGRR
jgi:hypothetical protein